MLSEIDFLGDKLFVPKPLSIECEYFLLLLKNICDTGQTFNYEDQIKQLELKLDKNITRTLRSASILAFNYLDCDRRNRGLHLSKPCEICGDLGMTNYDKDFTRVGSWCGKHYKELNG